MSLYLEKKDSKEKALESFLRYKSYLQGYTNFINESEFDSNLEEEILNINREYIQTFLENNEELEHEVFDCQFSNEMFQQFLDLNIHSSCNECSYEDKIIEALSVLYKTFIEFRLEYKKQKIQRKQEKTFIEYCKENSLKEGIFENCYRILEGLEVQENYYRNENALSGSVYNSNYLLGTEVIGAMKSLFDRVENRDNDRFDFMLEAIFVKARIAHHIHPFEDKNGRTSRMFMQYILFYEFNVETPIFYSFVLKGRSAKSHYRNINKSWNKDRKYCFNQYVHLLSNIFISSIQQINKRLQDRDSDLCIDSCELSEKEKSDFEKSFNYYYELF